MKLPRDVSGKVLVKSLERVGYQATRQTGSHVRLTMPDPAEHHLTIPMHNPVKIGTLSAILGEVARHLQISRDDLIQRLFG